MKNFKIFIFTLLVVIGQGELFAQKNVRNFTRKSAQMTDSIPVLNAKKDWLITVASLDSLIGGANSVGENTIQFSNGYGGFYQVRDTIIEEGDTLRLFAGIDSQGVLPFNWGVNNISNNNVSVSFGANNKSLGFGSFTAGYFNESVGDFSFSMGGGNRSLSLNSTCFGSGNIASAENSIVLGVENICKVNSALYAGSFAIITTNDSSFTLNSDTILAVGNGVSDNIRSNALTLRRDGALANTGAFGSTARETYVGSSDDTISNNIRYYRYNPASTVTSATIYLPPNPFDGQELIITGGGTITSGNVITTMTIAPNAGQSVLVNSHVLTVGTPISMYWDADDSLWITISN